MCSRSPQNLQFDYLALALFGVAVLQEMLRNVPKCTTHVQRHCFRSSNLLFCVVLAAVVAAVLKLPIVGSCN